MVSPIVTCFPYCYMQPWLPLWDPYTNKSIMGCRQLTDHVNSLACLKNEVWKKNKIPSEILKIMYSDTDKGSKASKHYYIWICFKEIPLGKSFEVVWSYQVVPCYKRFFGYKLCGFIKDLHLQWPPFSMVEIIIFSLLDLDEGHTLFLVVISDYFGFLSKSFVFSESTSN